MRKLNPASLVPKGPLTGCSDGNRVDRTTGVQEGRRDSTMLLQHGNDA